jgi:RES domain
MTEIWFRNADARYPCFQHDPGQAPGRWHTQGSGPAQYLADTPDGAWAEFLRHEEIVDAADLAGVARDLWAIEFAAAAETVAQPTELEDATVRGDESTYEACQAEAARHRALGATALVAPTAGLWDGAAGGQHCSGGSLREASPPRDGRTLALFGERGELSGWRCCHRGRPDGRLLGLVRPL